jgi:hypothetical protein
MARQLDPSVAVATQPTWLDDADGDLTVVDQICDVGQGRGIEGDFFA